MKKNSMPSLFIDTEKISKLRKEVQKPWKEESFWPWIFLRKFSIYLSYPIAMYTKITPNMITILGILFGLLASINFNSIDISDHIFGIIFYQLAYLADCVDGEVARMTKTKSELGHWLDSGLRYSLYVAFFSVMSYNFKLILPQFTSLIDIILITFILVSVWTTDNERIPQKLEDNNKEVKKKNYFIDVFIFVFATDPGFYLFYFIFILLCKSNIISMWVIYHFSIFILKNIYRLYNVVKSTY